MKPPRAGERVAFTTSSERRTGTAMTGTINGIVMVAVHDVYVRRSDGSSIIDENIMPVLAVRVGSILAVDESNEPQGAKR